MAGGKTQGTVISVTTELGPRARITLSPRDHSLIVRGAVESLGSMGETDVLNAGWDKLTTMRKRAIRRDLMARAHESGDLFPTE